MDQPIGEVDTIKNYGSANRRGPYNQKLWRKPQLCLFFDIEKLYPMTIDVARSLDHSNNLSTIQ